MWLSRRIILICQMFVSHLPPPLHFLRVRFVTLSFSLVLPFFCRSRIHSYNAILNPFLAFSTRIALLIFSKDDVREKR